MEYPEGTEPVAAETQSGLGKWHRDAGEWHEAVPLFIILFQIYLTYDTRGASQGKISAAPSAPQIQWSDTTRYDTMITIKINNQEKNEADYEKEL